jgi:hypothetical protein
MTTALMPIPQRTTQPPAFWHALCAALGATPRLSRELWGVFVETFPYRAQTVYFELERAFTVAPEAVVVQRLVHISQLVRPRDVHAASERLSPEGEGRRRADVRQFEENLLRHVDQTGHWC